MPASNVADLSIGIQTAKGTAAATPLIRTPIVSSTLRPARTVNRVEETGATRLGGPSYVAMTRVEGEVTFRVRASTILPFLWAALGAKATTGASDPYTHTTTLATTQPYLTLWTMLASASFSRLVDCKVTSLNFVSDAQGVLTATMGVVGLVPQYLTAANTTAALPTDLPLLHHEANATLQAEGSALAGVTAARINIGTGAESYQGTNITPDSIEEGGLDVTIEVDQVVTDFALWNRFHYGTASPSNNATPVRDVVELGGSGLDLKWSKRDSAGVAATPERSLQFTATKVQIENITGIEPATSGDPLTRTVIYRISEPASGSGLTAVVKNGTASYAAS